WAGVYRPEAVLFAISHAKNQLWAEEEIAEKGSHSVFGGIDADAVACLFGLYMRQLKLHQAIDFDDCIYKCVFLLREHEGIRARLAEKFQHMLVDEFQDTNFSQLAVV